MQLLRIYTSGRYAKKSTSLKDIIKDVLLSWGLFAEDEVGVIYLTNGFVFLLGKDPFLSHIQCGVFKGRTCSVFVDKREYGGAFWEQVEDAF